MNNYDFVYRDAERSYQEAYFGTGIGDILLDELQCTGDENSILDCPHNGVGNNDCSHGEDAGVVCQRFTTIAPTASSEGK